jgi:hypothetical protein
VQPLAMTPATIKASRVRDRERGEVMANSSFEG